jgi:hypothetical protein
LIVASSIARQTFDGINFPALVIVLCGGEDVDESFLVGEGVVFGLLGVSFTGSAASM